MIDFKGNHFGKEIMLWGVRWYVAYPISYRQLEEMMGERGVAVDHSTLNRWVIKYAPEVEKQFHRQQRPVGTSYGWTRPMFASKENGNISIVRWTTQGRPSIFC